MLPYLTTVPHVDEGAHGVEGACPAGQQVCPVVGVQHTDIVGTVSLWGQHGREGSPGIGALPTPSSLPLPGALGQGVSPTPGLHPGSLPPAWCQGSESLCPLTGLVWTSSGCTPAHCKTTGLFSDPPASWDPIYTWAAPAHRHLCTHTVVQSTLARAATSLALQAPNPAPNP